MALFNWDDEAKIVPVTTEELGIATDVQYLTYEFWEQKSYGILSNRIEAEVPAHGVRLVAVHRLQDVPQWISSDRHITQNGLELKKIKWNPESRTLQGEIELIGSFPLAMQLHVPAGFTCSGVKCKGAKCQVKEEENEMLAVLFKSDKTGIYSFELKF